MSDVNANIGISINASSALAELKALQRELANFHSQISRGSAASVAAQKNLQTNLLNSINATGKFTAQMGLVRTSTESFTHALEANKLSMAQYFRYAGASTKTFGRLFKSEFDTIGKVAEERVRKMQTQYIKMGRDANGAMKAMAITPTTLNMKDVATQTALAAQKQALFNQLVKQGSTNLLNFGKNTQWAGRQLMVGFSVPLAYFGAAAAKTFMDLEAQAVRFKRVYGDMFTTNEQTNKALTDIQNLAKEFTKYGVAVVDTMKMAADAAATGKQGAELTAQVAEATRLSVLGGIEQQKSLETTISLTNTFGIAAQDLKKNIDFLNAVENQTVVNIDDLTTAIPKAGPVVKQLGGNVQDLAFFLTAMKEGGINASEGANALKSGLASLINPTKKASEMLAGYGINIKAIVEGNAGNLRETVLDFASALDQLAPLDRSRAIEQLFGKFQFARLSTLFQNITKDGTQAARVLDLTGKSVEELAILSERELKTVEDAVGTNFKEAVQQLKLTIAPIGKTFLEAITPVIKTLGNLFDKFNNLGDGTKKFIVVMTTLVGILGPTFLMTFGLVANGIANIIKLFLALRVGFLKMTGDSKTLGATTNYLTKEQLEAETVAASLNQAHTRLTQQFEMETSAVNLLRAAYVEATIAGSKFARLNPGMMMPGKTPKKFAEGATYVPGRGTKDTVPAVLTPGEAVIPRDVAQNPQYQPIIDAMVNGKLQAYGEGTTGAKAGRVVFAHATDKTILSGGKVPGVLQERGYAKANAYTGLGFDIDEELHKRLTHNQASVREYENAIRQPGAVATMTGRLIDAGLSPDEAKKTTNSIRRNLIKSLISIPDNQLIGDKDIYSRMGNTKTGILGGLIKGSSGGATAKAIGHILDYAGVSGYSKPGVNFNDKKPITDVIKAVKETNSNPSITQALEKLQKADPNRQLAVRVEDGKITAFQRNEVSRSTGKIKPTVNNGVLINGKFVSGRAEGSSGQIKVRASKKAMLQALSTLEGLTATDIAGREITAYGKQISQGTGFSNIGARHLSGVYETLDGKKVFVKPMIDEKAALAEQRATIIARDVHGLDAPKQTLRIIQDPLTGEKMFALESEFNPKFDPANMTGKFSKADYFKQLVASALRGDKDLAKGNLSGNVLADVGTAGVFEKASGKRDFAKVMPSMAEQARINLLGVPGGAKRFFAESTLDIPKNMTPEQYDKAMKAEIDRVLPKLKETISKFALTDAERPVYEAMIKRLEEGRKVDWKEFHKIHSAVKPGKKPAKAETKTVAAKTGELIYDPKTGKTVKITEQNTKPLPAGVKTTTKAPKDNRVVRVKQGRIILPGADTGLDANGNPLPKTTGGVRNIPFSSAADQTRIRESQTQQLAATQENTNATKETTAKTKKLGAKFEKATGVFAGLTILGSFMHGRIGDLAQKLLPFAIGIQILTSLLPSLKSGFIKLGAAIVANPYIAAAAAIAALAIAWKVLDDKARKQAEAQSKYIDQISATTEKMKKVGEVTGKVGASEIMARRREGGTADKFTTGYDRAGQQFGTNFLSSDVGKSIYDTFKTNLAKGGTDAVKQIARELSAYVSDGLMTAEEANSVARSIGINMSDMTIAANIKGQLREILGPNGEDLTKEPLKVRVKIIQEQAGTFADIKKQYEESGGLFSSGRAKELAAGMAASGTQTLEIIQAQRDAQSKLYDDQIRTLEAQLATTTDKKKQAEIEGQISDLKIKQSKDDDKLAGQREKAIKDQLAAFKIIKDREKFSLDKPEQAAYFASLDQQIKDKYKNDPLASTFLGKAAGTKSLDLEIAIKTMVGAGDLTPNTATKLIDMFGKEGEQKLETLLTTTFAKKDPGKVQELINIATNIKGKGGKEIGLKLLTEIGAKGQENKFDDRLNALTLLQQMDGKELNLALFLKGDGLAKIDKLVPLLNKVEAQKEINIKVLQTLEKDPDMPSLKGLIDDWERYKNLPTDLQKTVTQTYISVYKTITDKNVASMARAEAEKRGLRGRSASAFINKYGNDKDALAALLTREQFAPGKEPNTIPKGSGGGSSTGNRDTTLDNLLNRLKMVRDASINAVGGLKELQRITAGSGIEKFSGVINQLMTGKDVTAQNRGFISFIESMDDATRKTYMTIKNGKVILTQAGKDLAEAFNEQTLGDFNVAQVDTITKVKAQQTAFIKLKAAGVDSATALNMVADAELAIAINSSVEPAAKLKEMAIKATDAKNAVENLNLAFKQTMQTSMSELDMLKQLPNLVDQMQAIGMNGEQIQAVLNNPDFAREMLNNLKDGKLTSQELADYINSIPARKQIEIDVAMKTPEGMQGLFDKAMGNAQEYFNTLEAAIQLKFKQPIKDAQKAVEDAQDAVQKIQDGIAGLQDQIDSKQRSIELNITRKIEQYQADIDAIQEKIKAQFDKPIAVLNEESGKLSHDLGVMDHAAQAINEKYDTQANALTKIANINSEIAAQQKQQLTLADALSQGDISAAAAAAQDMRATQAADQINKTQEALQAARDLEIANLRNAAGQTRAQIEERQYQISEQVYTLEQGRKVLENEIATIQETKIAPLNAQRVIAEREIRDLQDEIYNRENGIGVSKENNLKLANQNLTAAQNTLKAKQDELAAELDVVDKQRDRWVQAQNAIDLAKVKSDAFAKSMEYNVTLVEKLAKAWSNVSTKTVTQTATGPTAAQKEYDADLATLNSLKGIGGYVYQKQKEAFDAKYPNGRPMQFGGFVGGSGMTDKVPALLTPGEFVMNKAGARAFGPMLEQINSSKYPSMLSPSNLSSPVFTNIASTTLAPSNITSSSSVNNNNSSVYNYSVGITVNGSNSSADDIARVVMTQIKNVDSQRIRGQRA